MGRVYGERVMKRKHQDLLEQYAREWHELLAEQSQYQYLEGTLFIDQDVVQREQHEFWFYVEEEQGRGFRDELWKYTHPTTQ